MGRSHWRCLAILRLSGPSRLRPAWRTCSAIAFYVRLQRHWRRPASAASSGLIDLAYARGYRGSRPTSHIVASNDYYEATSAGCASPVDSSRLKPIASSSNAGSPVQPGRNGVVVPDIRSRLASTVEIAERCAFRPPANGRAHTDSGRVSTVGAGSADSVGEEASELRRQA